MVDHIMQMPERTKIQLLAPVVRGRKGEHVKVLDQARKSGYVRVRIDGNLYELSEDIRLDKNIKHNIEVVVDRLIVKEGIEKRLTDSIETVMALSGGLMTCLLYTSRAASSDMVGALRPGWFNRIRAWKPTELALIWFCC